MEKCFSKYKQISQFYADEIKAGRLRQGQQLPTEAEITERFSVSRVTVRKALDELVEKDLITKVHSKGSVVKENDKIMCLDSLMGFTEEMSRRGLSVSTKVLSATLETAGEHISNKLDIDSRSKVYLITRLRLVEDEVIAVEKVAISYYRCPDLLKYDLSGSLYKIISQEYGHKIVRANEVLEATLADKREIDLLGIKTKQPVLKIERNTFLDDQAPLEFTSSIYRGDKYKFRVTLNK